MLLFWQKDIFTFILVNDVKGHLTSIRIIFYKVHMANSTKFGTTVNWVIGILFTLIGLVNVFSGNDPEYGVFIILLSLVYYPPIHAFIHRLTGVGMTNGIKTILGLFILWASLGVGELITKIEQILQSM
ncbi:hypothetical protein PQG22_01445 [Aquirufa beregesia]